MTDDNGKRQYHPAFRALTWIVPVAALAAIAFILLFGGGDDEGTGIEIVPPQPAGIPYVRFAEIDTLIAGATKAFERKDYDESARLLARARFFIHSGIREGRFDHMPANLELILGLSEFLRGYQLKGILFVTAAAETDPLNEMYAWYLGMMHLSKGNNKEAKEWFEKTAALGGLHAESARKALEEI